MTISTRGKGERPPRFARLAVVAGAATSVSRVGAGLPPVHRDPFDRMLVAQGRLERLAIVTNDAVFKGYDVKTVW